MNASATPLTLSHVQNNLELYIPQAQLEERIQAMAQEINARYS